MMKATHKPRSDISVIILHWLIVALVVVSLATGAHLALDRNDTVASIWAAWLSTLPQGAIVHWHLLSGWALVGLLLAYLAFIIRSGQWRKLLANARVVGGTSRLLANLSSILSLLLLVAISATGTWMFLGLVGTSAALQWHAAMATALIALTIVHVLLQTLAGRFWAILRARWQRVLLGLVSASVAAVVVAGSGWWLTQPQLELVVEHSGDLVVLDGVADESVWAKLAPVTVTASHGAGFSDGQTDVTIRGFHDGMSVFFWCSGSTLRTVSCTYRLNEQHRVGAFSLMESSRTTRLDSMRTSLPWCGLTKSSSPVCSHSMAKIWCLARIAQ